MAHDDNSLTEEEIETIKRVRDYNDPQLSRFANLLLQKFDEAGQR